MAECTLDEVTGCFISNPSPDNNVLIEVLDEETGLFKEVSVPREQVLEEQQENRQKKHRPNTRKRVSNPQSWQKNVRKLCRQSGQDYVSSRGKNVPAKSVKTKKDCLKSCKFGCAHIISEDLRKCIHKKYYELDQNQKYSFILETSEKTAKKRSTCNSDRKKFTYIFYFNVKGSYKKVCKPFYLSTLDISQKTVYGAHKRKDPLTGTASSDKRSRHNNHRRISDAQRELVRKHIDSFPRVDSHYCRSTSRRQYLDSLLSISKMYELYLEFSKDLTDQPVKKSMYTKIFNEEYNLSFHHPKKDRCDLCEEFKIVRQEGTASDELKQKYENHISEKDAMRHERNKDRMQSETPVLCFDLQNIISCPRAEISCFFYLSKLNLYNLTAHLSTDKKVYCALWNETFAGKSGNDVASALIAILKAVLTEYPNMKKIILWSDSCVPQNRNSLMSVAILNFLKEHEEIESIEIKYSTPGHSAVQEVDSVHSCIDRVMAAAEFYSPLSLMRLLKKVDLKKPYKIIQMQKDCIFAYNDCVKLLNYSVIPFTKVTALKFTQCYFTVFYKTSHTMTEWLRASILKNQNRPRRNLGNQAICFPRDIPEPRIVRARLSLPPNKIKAIKKMIKWMPKNDQDFFNALLREVEPSSQNEEAE